MTVDAIAPVGAASRALVLELGARPDTTPLTLALARSALVLLGVRGETGDPDSQALATALARRAPRTGLLWAATSDDLPYNLARRALTLDHLSYARSGVIFGAGPAETERERIQVVRDLWNSWPVESLLADRANRIFADTSNIRAVAASGPAFPVAGALNSPSSRQGEPVSAITITDPVQLDETVGLADLAVIDASLPGASALFARARELLMPVALSGTSAELSSIDEHRRALVHAHIVDDPSTLAETAAPRTELTPGTSLRTFLGFARRTIDLSDRPLAFGGRA